MTGACTCRHPRMLHRRGVGRCLAVHCGCLFAPPAPARAHAEQVARGRVTVDGNSTVLDYSPPTDAQRALRTAQRTKLERMLWRVIEEAGLPLPDELEYRFAKSEGRQWRADGAYLSPHFLLIEVDGGTWSGGRHSQGAGFQGDAEKLNCAAILGWRVLRFTGPMIRSGEAVRTIKRALKPAEVML